MSGSNLEGQNYEGTVLFFKYVATLSRLKLRITTDYLKGTCLDYISAVCFIQLQAW